MTKLSLIALTFFFALTVASSAQGHSLRDANVHSPEPIENGGTYYITPPITQLGGGMTLYKTGNETCPLSVGPEPFDPITFVNNRGLPWTISTPLKIKYVLGRRVDIFSTGADLPDCAPSPAFWTIVEEEDGSKSVKVTSSETAPKGGLFILPYTLLGYQIMFCTDDGDFCGYVSSNGGLLVITDNPYLFVFRKVEPVEVPKQLINNVLEA